MKKSKENQNKGGKKLNKKLVIAAAGLLFTCGGLVACGTADTPKQYVVTVQSETDGFTSYSITVKEGVTISEIKNQLRSIEGYTLEGVYKDQACQQPYADTDVISANTTVYLKFEIQKFKLTLPEQTNFNIELTELSDLENIPYNTEVSFKVTLHEGYTKSEITVKANDEELELTEGQYTFTMTKDTTITVEGVEHDYLTFTFDTDHYSVKAKNGWIEGNVIIPSEYNGKEGKYPVTIIEDNAFSSCDGITSVVIEEGITSIGAYAFYYCDDLGRVDIPNSVISIGDSAFQHCRSLNSVTLGEKVSTIGQSAFESTEVGSIIIPDSVTKIGNHAFYRSNLTEITLGPKRPDIFSAYEDCRINKVTYRGSTEEWISAGISSDFQETAANFDLYTTDGLVDSYTFTSDVPNWAFAYVKSLKTVTFSAGATKIGEGAFYQSGITGEVIFPEGLTYIDLYAFSYCSGITSLEIGSDVETIDDAFSSCGGITSVKINSKKVFEELCGKNYDSGKWLKPLIQTGETIKIAESIYNTTTARTYLLQEFTKSEQAEDGYYTFTKD